MSRQLALVNETSYATDAVRAVLRDALHVDQWPQYLHDILTITVLPDKGRQQHYGGYRMFKPGKDYQGKTYRGYIAVLRLWVVGSGEFPIATTQHAGGKGFPYYFQDWRSYLYRTAAHEYWHMRNGKGELKAEEYAHRQTARRYPSINTPLPKEARG